jgi:hypothetical protein
MSTLATLAQSTLSKVLAVPITFPSQAGKIVTTKTLKNIMF